MMFGLFALASAAIFFGAAFYINFAEQSARLSLDDRSLLAEWKPAYKRGFIILIQINVPGSNQFTFLTQWGLAVAYQERPLCV
jgi:hypothetical protein